MMDPTDNRPGQPQQPDLEQDLEEIRSALPRMEGPEPPELVDMAILNAARRELTPRRRRLRWLGAFATASVIILTLTIVIQQDPNPPVARDESEGLKLERPAPEESRRKADDTSTLRAPPTAAAPAASRAMRATAAEESGFSDRDRAPESAKLSEQQIELDATAAKEPSEAAAIPELEKKAGEESLLPAEQWIERLLELRASGQRDRLEAELAAFREAYPDHPLPPELAE